MIPLPTFLELLNKQKNISHYSVIGFIGKEYPLLFFSLFFLFLQKNNIVIESISLETSDASLIKANVSTISFKGQIIYWLKDFSTLPIKKQQEWINYFQSYNGPHIIVFFSTEENVELRNISYGQIVSIPHEVSLQDMSMIRFLVNDKTKKRDFPVNVGLQIQMVSLDTLCLLHHYELVVGKNWDFFIKEWGPYILEPISSLFLLSQYFFGKKAHLFFIQWSHSYDFYLPTFWPTFWADQLWRAYIYCDLMKQKKYIEAKKVQYKLPYSLINRDWPSLSLQELQHAHNYLCTLDYRLKNGGSFIALELFFNKFFENKFR